jgi:hypothetical protein
VQPALEVEQAPLLQVAADELGLLAPGAQGVELGLLGFVGGEAQLGDRTAARGVVELGITGQSADQHHPVDRRAAGLPTLVRVAVVEVLRVVLVSRHLISLRVVVDRYLGATGPRLELQARAQRVHLGLRRSGGAVW